MPQKSTPALCWASGSRRCNRRRLRRGEGAVDEVGGGPDAPLYRDGYEIHYYGFGRPSFRTFQKEAGARYRAEVIDTWNMTVEDAGVHAGRFRIPLPGREYMAIRLVREA